MSIHRATTVGAKSPISHVILKNTTMEKESTSSTTTASINRSQSLLTTTGRLPVLAPSPGDRARLEALVADVWTRGILPFPGMTARARSEHAVRSSASSMIRKLSVTSIASTFTRRSPSVTSLKKIVSDDGTEAARRLLDATTARAPPATGLTLCQPDDSVHSCLSIIDDDSEKHSPTDSRINSGEPGNPPAEHGGRRLVTIGNSPGLNVDHITADSPVLRTSSANSLWINRQVSDVSKKSSCPSDKENIQHDLRGDRNTSIPRLTNARHKVEMLRRGVMAQGIRSFFR